MSPVNAPPIVSFYVAGSSRERARYSSFVRALEAVGFRNAYNWVACYHDFEERCPAGGFEPAELAEELSTAGQKCVAAVRECDVFIFLVPETVSKGAWVELGMARALRKRVITCGNSSQLDVWHLHEEHECSDVDGLARVLELAVYLGDKHEAAMVAECNETEPVPEDTSNDAPHAAESAPPLPAALTAESSPPSSLPQSPAEPSRPAAPYSGYRPCNLELTLLDGLDLCKACGWRADEHPRWSKK